MVAKSVSSPFPIDHHLVTYAAEAGVPYAQWLLALGYHTGHHRPRSPQLARKWYEASAKSGSYLAHRALGALLLGQSLGPSDVDLALYHLEQCAKLGLNCREAGLRRMYGIGCAPDLNAALRWFELGHANGDMAAGCIGAWIKATGALLPESHMESRTILTRMASGGDLDAKYALGLYFVSGFACNKSSQDGQARLLEAAEAGHVMAALALGEHISTSPAQGDTSYHTQGMGWLLKAARDGDGKAQGLVASEFALGINTPKDLSRAKYWFKKSRTSGFPGAEYYKAKYLLACDNSVAGMERQLLALQTAAANGYLAARGVAVSVMRALSYEAPNHPQAVEILSEAIVFGDGAAIATLAELYCGEIPNTPPALIDRKIGEFWLQTAAAESDSSSIVDYAQHLINSHPSAKRTAHAVALLQYAYGQGDARSAGILAYQLNFNRHMIRNSVAAAKINEFAAKRGDFASQWNVSLNLRDGQGINIDHKAADYWQSKAIESYGHGIYVHEDGSFIKCTDDRSIRRETAKVLPIKRAT